MIDGSIVIDRDRDRGQSDLDHSWRLINHSFALLFFTTNHHQCIQGGVEDRWNLSFTENCHRSAYVTPKKGRAILFYNHLSARCFEGQQWGCELGEMDKVRE